MPCKSKNNVHICIKKICLKIKKRSINVISWTVAHAISFLKSVCLPKPKVAITRLISIHIVKKKKLFTS